ncbi:ABC transporter ATP-binding protein [Marinobacterium zhoushanense]|uniref:ABC transporter ATP-binding protein n=1 Tax=Marinobacterium zhoushanense TaxID=1679163 RepID=A0ABQ1K449_9GAMM|nr:ABC transporter ATP-binding protein [Marinobacterium zhoushanense]GGB83385.1 ABC transporter ATP-binding protein [Marinobacterium zhoushanense]
MREILVQAEAIAKSYVSGRESIRVLHGLSLTLYRGEAVAVIGPSGSGKSTLLNLFNGLLRPDAGRLLLLGEDLAQLQERDLAALRRSRIATLFQDGNLIPTLTVARNLAFRRTLAGRREGDEAALLEMLDIAATAERFPDQLSGGQRQRAALACAFAMTPELILADEPTGSLDIHNAERVMQLFFDRVQASHLSALIVTHNLQLARRCDRVLELVDGALRPWG